MPVRLPVNVVQMTHERITWDLFGHYVTHVVFTFHPIGFNDAGSNGFTDNMEANSYMFLREIMTGVSSTLNDTKIVTKNFGRTSSVSRDVDTQASKVITYVNCLLCCCAQCREFSSICAAGNCGLALADPMNWSASNKHIETS